MIKIKFSKEGLDFIKKNPPILLSLILIIILPLFIFSTVTLIIKSFEENANIISVSKAIGIKNLFSHLALEALPSLELLQKKVEKVSKENEDIKNLQVVFPSKDKFKIVASAKKSEIGKEISERLFFQAWNQEQTNIYLAKEKGIRYWGVISPFFNEKKEKIGLISFTLSLEETDRAILKRIRDSYLFAILGTLFVLILILQHTRLFGYVDLSRKLWEIDKAKDAFLNMAVHELRSPIVAVRGFLEFLKKPILSLNQPKAKEDFERIEISAKRLNDLIDDMLQVVRLTEGRLSFEPELINPEKIIEEEVKVFLPKAKEKNLLLKFEKKGEGFIKVNPNRLREILVNLIENAIKYTKRGCVIVKTEIDRARDRYYLIVEDTGIGISAENQKRLFERFFRVKSRETAEIAGTGLGLWIVKELIKKMGGEIFVESLEGSGSKFKVVFPLIKK